MPKIKHGARKINQQCRFASDEAEVKFDEKLRARELLHERGFEITDSPTLGLPSFISDVISQRGWQEFAKHPDSPLVAVVKEFYANWLDPTVTTVIVREVEVDCSPRAINELYGFHDIADEYSSFLDTISEEDVNHALLTLTVEGTFWTVSNQGTRTFPRKNLLPQAKVWYNFVRSRLDPTTHDATVSSERLLLLYAVLNEYTINIGSVIHKAMTRRKSKNAGKLFFPTTITMLCRQAGVPFGGGPEEELVANKSKFTSANIRKVLKEAKEKSSPECSPPNSPHGASSSSSQRYAGIYDRLDQQDARQDMICERLNQFWSYTKSFDNVVKKAIQKNTSKALPAFPAFPDSILEPWTSPTEPDNAPSDEESDE